MKTENANKKLTLKAVPKKSSKAKKKTTKSAQKDARTKPEKSVTLKVAVVAKPTKREVFLATLSGIRQLIDVNNGNVLAKADMRNPDHLPIMLQAEKYGLKVVPRKKAKPEVRKAYERAWAKEHQRRKKELAAAK